MTDSTESREQARAEVAGAFEKNASAIVESRGRAPLKSRGGKARLLKTESGKIVTHGQLVAGLLQKQAIEAEVVDGKRPEWISCEVCQVPVKVAGVGSVSTKCAKCNGRACLECGKKRNPKKYGVPGRCMGCISPEELHQKLSAAGKAGAAALSPSARTEKDRNLAEHRRKRSKEQRRADGAKGAAALAASRSPKERARFAKRASASRMTKMSASQRSAVGQAAAKARWRAKQAAKAEQP